jgi:hypothetical protein
MRRLGLLVLVLSLALPIAGCVIEEPGHHRGWCWWHPYRCR